MWIRGGRFSKTHTYTFPPIFLILWGPWSTEQKNFCMTWWLDLILRRAQWTDYFVEWLGHHLTQVRAILFRSKSSTVDEEKKKINQNQTELDEWKVTSTLEDNDGGCAAGRIWVCYLLTTYKLSSSLVLRYMEGKGLIPSWKNTKKYTYLLSFSIRKQKKNVSDKSNR